MMSELALEKEIGTNLDPMYVEYLEAAYEAQDDLRKYVAKYECTKCDNTGLAHEYDKYGCRRRTMECPCGVNLFIDAVKDRIRDLNDLSL